MTETLDTGHGLADVLKVLLEDSATRDTVASWVGEGPNQAITVEAITQRLGSEKLAALAAKAGVSPAEAASILAEELPRVVDAGTPPESKTGATPIAEFDRAVIEATGPFILTNVLQQAAQAMLSQANQIPQGVLRLLG